MPLPTPPHPARLNQETDFASCAADCTPSSAAGVVQDAERESGLTDLQREVLIQHYGNLLVRFTNEGKRGMARKALQRMHSLIAGRSAESRAEQLRCLQPAEEFQTFVDLAQADIEKGKLG